MHASRTLLVSFLMVALFTRGNLVHGAPPQVSDIEAAWKRQEEAFKEIEVEWAEGLFMPAGSQSELWVRLGGERRAKWMNPDGLRVPDQDLTFPLQAKIQLKGRDFFMESLEPHWSPTDKKFVPSRVEHFFDDKGSRHFRPNGIDAWSGLGYPSAQVLSKLTCTGAQELACRPLILALRPLDRAYRMIRLDDVVITGKTAVVGGRECIEVVQLHNGSRESAPSYWLSKNENYLPIKAQQIHEGKPSLEMELKLEEDRPGVFRPVSWRVDSFLSGKLIRSYRCSVVRWANQVSGPPSHDLPAGTHVYDFTETADRQYYLLREDGSRRYLSRNERFLPYHELKALIHRETVRTSWATTAGVVVGLLIAFAALGWWYRRANAARRAH